MRVFVRTFLPVELKNINAKSVTVDLVSVEPFASFPPEVRMMKVRVGDKEFIVKVSDLHEAIDKAWSDVR